MGAATLRVALDDRAFSQPSTESLQAVEDVLRRAAAQPGRAERPPPEQVLKAVLTAERQKSKLNARAPFFDMLTGHGQKGGKRWRLVYLANKKAVMAARQGVDPPSPFDCGWYVDGFVTAVQRFEDGARRLNQNGVFELLGIGGFFLGYFARFKWPSPARRTAMAFEPVTNNLHAFGQSWSWPFSETSAGPEGGRLFEAARMADLSVFNFCYLDEEVAVARGKSGGIALWGATDPEWDSKHLGESIPAPSL